MKETTALQIAGMKEQRFGIEIEGNNITREKAAKTAAEFFGTGRFQDTALRNGYYTWSAWDEKDREWKFQKDVSISGPDSQKCELVSPILQYEDMELLQGLIRALRKAGMKSDHTRGCGVHVHVDGAGHTPQSIRTLVNIMAAHESQLVKAIGITRYRMANYCKTVDPKFLELVNSKKPKTMEKLEDIWYQAQGENYGRTQHYNRSRYHILNLHSFFNGHGTVEFRCFQYNAPEGGKRNGLHAGETKAFIQLCLAINYLSKQIRFASPKPQQTENEAYAFRCWMLRLGFIGEEFKTARDYYLKNMNGNCAWRHAE
jgi:hypothetical protein